MTEKELKEWRLFGCASRCIIEAAKLCKKPIDRDAFAVKFSKYFPSDQFGLLTLDRFCLVVTELGLAESVHAVRNAAIVCGALQAKQSVFVFTDFKVDRALNVCAQHFHCRLCVGWQDDSFRGQPALQLWEPHQDETDSVAWVVLDRLDREFAHYIVLG